MKYTMLATALAFVLGGTALADPDPQGPQTQAGEPDEPAGSAQTAPSSTTTTTPSTTSETTSRPPASDDTADAQAAQRAKSLGSVDLLFDFDSANLKAGARSDLVTLARWAKCNDKGAVILEGHTDVIGAPAYNMKLAGERAAAVREKLVAMGVPSDRIVITVYGENGPRRGSHAEDRRVTVRAISTPVQPSDITAER